MAPEQLRQDPVDRRTDVFAAGIVLWELLTGQKMIDVEKRELKDVMQAILEHRPAPPSTIAPVPPALEALVMRALEPDPAARWPSADAMANALEEACPPARAKDVAAWVIATAGGLLESRAEKVASVEQASAIHVVDDRDRPPASEGGTTIASDLPPAFEPAPFEPARRSRWKIGAGALALLLVLTGSIVLARRHDDRPPPVVDEREPAPSASGSARSVVEVPVDTAPTANDVVDDAGPAHRKTRRKTPRAAAPDCDPPYSIDSRGIRIPRPECFARSP
jgi:serine/threonine-protein kinase